MKSWFVFILGLMGLSGCSGSEAECKTDQECPPGRYCQSGACAFDCTVDAECPPDYTCTARGRCERGCRPTNGGVEACDGLDNDCDEQIDEDWPDLGAPCHNAGCAAGTWICSADGAAVVCDGPQPALDDATCDGADDDCDGLTDEDATEIPCPLQGGVCGEKVQTCQAGALTACDYGPDHTPGTDGTCDGLDNDCDGATDEDAPMELVPELGALGTDGLDNNCNGLVDEPGGVMVPVPLADKVWMDAYEIGVYESPDCSGAPLGVASDDYPAGWPIEGAASTELYACSLAGVMPSGHLSWYRADRACAAQGKRLCRRVEWAAGCYGEGYMAYPYGAAFMQGLCNDPLGGSGQPEPTGARPTCQGTTGTFDQSGNLNEWMLDWDDDPGLENNALTGGHSYVCEFCNQGTDCWDCLPGQENDDHVADVCDCFPDGGYDETYLRNTAWSYFGTRCCLDGP